MSYFDDSEIAERYALQGYLWLLQRIAGALRIRAAREADAGELTRIAHAAKRHWRYPEEWIRLWESDLTVTAATMDRGPVYCAVRDDRILGFYALCGESDPLELEHMWVDPRFLGTGVGAELLRHAAAWMRERGHKSLRIASDPQAEGFYRKMGAARVGTVTSSPAGRELPLLVLRVG